MIINLSMELDGAWLLCIGGGRAQKQKLGYLLANLEQQTKPLSPLAITLISPEISPELEALLSNAQDSLGPEFLAIELIRREYQEADLYKAGRSPNLVYAFTNKPELNAQLARLCRTKGILVNAAGISGPGTFSSPAIGFTKDTNGGGFLVSVASLEGTSKTRGRNPRAAKAVLDSALGKGHNPPPDRPPYLPFMLGLQNVLVLGGERGEGLQKTEKLSLYAKQVTVVPENDQSSWAKTAPEAPLHGQDLIFPPGPVRWVAEKLWFTTERRARIAPHSAAWYCARPWRLKRFLKTFDFVCSDLVNRRENELIHRVCSSLHIRHTVVDTKDLSDTWFMGLVDAGPVLAGISSRGNCAFYSKKLREELELDFSQRAPLAKALAELRAALPRNNREEVLEKAWKDPHFSLLAIQDPQAAQLHGLSLQAHTKGAL